jgi:hypothetical protein
MGEGIHTEAKKEFNLNWLELAILERVSGILRWRGFLALGMLNLDKCAT